MQKTAEDYPCKPKSIFKSLDEFKKTLQDYAMKNGFMFVTKQRGRIHNTNNYRISMVCMSWGKPRVHRNVTGARKPRPSIKVGCKCQINAIIRQDGEANIIHVEKCNWDHTNGCVPSQSLLHVFRLRSGDYFKSLSLYHKIRFKRLVDLGKSNAYLLRFVKSIFPANAQISNQTVINWKQNFIHINVRHIFFFSLLRKANFFLFRK